MRKGRFIGLAVAVLTLAAAPVTGATPTGYVDPTGDNGTAADVQRVTVELGTDGKIAVKLAIASMPRFGDEGIVFAVFDTDRNASTGTIWGGEYVMVFDFESGSGGLMRWDGSAYVDATGDATTIVGNGSAEFRLSPAAIGGTTTFDFVVAAATGAPATGQIDLAPDTGSWFFEAKKAVTVESVDAKFVPAAPKAGTVFQAPVVRIKLSDGTTITAPSYRCVAQLAGKLLRGTGRGGCTFKLPKAAKGKRLSVTLFVTYKGTTDEFEPYVFRVR